jgi:hypothetical protein
MRSLSGNVRRSSIRLAPHGYPVRENRGGSSGSRRDRLVILTAIPLEYDEVLKIVLKIVTTGLRGVHVVSFFAFAENAYEQVKPTRHAALHTRLLRPPEGCADALPR